MPTVLRFPKLPYTKANGASNSNTHTQNKKKGGEREVNYGYWSSKKKKFMKKEK